MREYGSNINLPSLDNLFSSEQERQDTKPAYPRRFMNSITCCLFASRSSISSFNFRLKIERFPSASSSLRSTIWTPARRLFSFALFVRVKSLYSPCSAR